MKKVDKLIIKILLEICDILTHYSDKITFIHITSIRKMVDEFE